MGRGGGELGGGSESCVRGNVSLREVGSLRARLGRSRQDWGGLDKNGEV